MRIFRVKTYLLIVFLLIAVLPTSLACSPLQKAKNVVLMIGDGMGFNHLSIADAYNEDRDLFMKANARMMIEATTYSANSSISDSAAAATALATGIKVNNGEISFHDNQNLAHIGELAKSTLKGVGIIASEALYGATPASFSAHNSSRNNIDEITQEQIAGNIDLFLGAGKDYYEQRISIFSEHQRTYFSSVSDLEDGLQSVLVEDQSNRFFAAFSSIATQDEIANDFNPTLANLSQIALEYLSSKYQEEGFFLMIEASHIDKKSHANDLQATTEEVLAFDEAVKTVVEWSNQNQETFVLVTADHETGGLSYQGQSKDQLTDALFSTTGHTASNVPVILYRRFKNVKIQADTTIDNTEIAILLHDVLFDDND